MNYGTKNSCTSDIQKATHEDNRNHLWYIQYIAFDIYSTSSVIYSTIQKSNCVRAVITAGHHIWKAVGLPNEP